MGNMNRHSKILIIDDNQVDRKLMRLMLENGGFQVVELSSGESCIETIEAENPNLVLLDILMPDMSGNEVLRMIRENLSESEIPVIMVTAKSDTSDVVASLKLGASDYLIKPFQFDVAIKMIRAHLGIVIPSNFGPKQTPINREYEAINLHELLTNQTLGFDVYLHLQENMKYLKYIRSDELITDAQIERLKLRNVSELFVKADDLPKFRSLFSRSLASKLTDKTLDPEQKLAVVKNAAKNLLENVTSISSEQDCAQWSNNCVHFTKVIVSDLCQMDLTTAYESMEKLLASTPTLVTHSFAVSSLSVVLGMALGIFESKSLQELSMGGLLHDLGMAKLPPELLEKHLLMQEMTADELKIFHKHPALGVENIVKVSKTPIITDNVINIILEHHECADGSGFPAGLPSLRQSYLVKIASVADQLSLELSKYNAFGGDIKSILLSILKKQETGQKKLDTKILKQLLDAL